jgi:trimeric autotransporter adhesin
MGHNGQRIVLLTGVSMLAVGLAAPAEAAVLPGLDHTVASANVRDTVTICLTDQSCEFGVSNSGTGTVASAVNDVASGEVQQIGTASGVAPGGDVVLHIINSGRVDISALATAVSAGGLATALASIAPAIAQTGEGHGDVSVDLSNNGTLLIRAGASADATHAFAAAMIDTAIHQYAQASGTGDGAAAFANNGALTIDAAATANGQTGAGAAAAVYRGIGNYVDALGSGDATGSVVNSGDMEVGALASATLHGAAGNANAFAFAGDAVQQTGYAEIGDVAVDIGNSGTIEIDAAAFASALATAPLAGSTALNATAHAAASFAISQTATAMAGDIGMGFSNNGTIDISAKATAVAAFGAAGTQAGTASASGYMEDALYQAAYAPSGGNIGVTATNGGTFEISDLAKATGANAMADAHVKFAISQSAVAVGGDADVAFTNTGTLDETLAASARGTQGFASAAVTLTQAIFQEASATADASATLDNEGAIEVGLLAAATAAQSANAQVMNWQGIAQVALSPGAAQLSLTNSGTIRFSATASAVAHNSSSASAAANITVFNKGIYQTAEAKMVNHSSATSFIHFTSMPLGTASVALDNSGTISIDSLARAKADDFAEVLVAASSILVQHADGTNATVTLDNSGTIDTTVVGQASGGQIADAAAFASGIKQAADARGAIISGTRTSSGDGHLSFFAGGIGPASASLTNSGTISLLAEAHAINTATAVAASRSFAFAGAAAIVPIAVSQAAFGTDASASLVNNGTIRIAAGAVSTGLENAAARADITGIGQAALATGSLASIHFSGSSATGFGGRIFQGPAVVDLANSGSLELSGAASASAEGAAQILVHEFGVQQLARGAAATDLVTNSGTISLEASGNFKAGSGSAFVLAGGIDQQGIGFDSASLTVANSGVLKVGAVAHGSALLGNATAVAIAGAISQSPLSPGAETGRVANSGLIEISANARAAAADTGLAVAYAGLINQAPWFGDLVAVLDNSGQLKVTAAASAVGGAGAYGSAKATALHVDVANVVADVVNSGSITAAASVHADGPAGSAVAYAAAISMFATNHGTSASVGSIGGTIANSGSIKVAAKVDSANSGTLGATATGIYLSSTRNNATIVNSGTIDVSAIAAHDKPANAWGVHVVTGYDGDPAQAVDKLTFTNDGGTIIVRQSTDGGTTWKHGTAIDLSEAPNASVVNLIGDGVIYGNIAVQSGDRIDVKAGTTYFDGIIGPSFKPVGGVTSALLDSGVFGSGTLNIMDGGNLILADARGAANAAMYDGPSYVAVDTLNVASDGTLTLNLAPSSGGVQAVGSYTQVYADMAKLAGTLIANVTPASGKFADSYSWQNVIDANALSGKFDTCALGGVYAESALLKLTCSYDSKANVDLSLNRVAFNAVAGLTANESAVGGGLESAYRDDGAGAQSAAAVRGAGAAGSGPFGALVGNLFQLNGANYALALDQLSGAGYAGYLQSFNTLGYHYNGVLDRASDCDRPVLAGSALQCRSSPFHLWAQLDDDHLSEDGDSELAGGSGHRSTLIAGADVNLSPVAVVGISAGSVSNHDRFADAAGSDIKGNGWQLGAYGVYDPGAFFVKAVGTYSALKGGAHRHLDFGVSPGAITGNPDVTMWTLGVHGGYRLPLSATNLVTPFVDYDYTDAKLDGFTETGTTGADLKVNGGSEKHSWLTGGVKWTGRFGGIVPQASVAWRHAFGDKRASFNANFAASPATSDFDIVSMSEKSDALLAGVSVGGKLGPVDVRVAYQGAFSGGATEHSGFLKLVLPLKAPAAPHHASTASPQPQPQPQQQQAATQTCAGGTVMLATASCPTLSSSSAATPLERYPIIRQREGRGSEPLPSFSI